MCQYSLTTADCRNLKIYLYCNCKSNYESDVRSTAQPLSAGSTVRGSLTDGDFSLLCHAQTGSAFHQASSASVARDSVSRVNGPERERDHSHLVPRLRISGAEFLLAILRGQRQLYTSGAMIQC